MVYDAFDYGISESLIIYDQAMEAAKKQAEEKGANVVVISGSDLDPFYEQVDLINEEWFKEMEAAGFDKVREYYDLIGECLAEKA